MRSVRQQRGTGCRFIDTLPDGYGTGYGPDERQTPAVNARESALPGFFFRNWMSALMDKPIRYPGCVA